MRRAVHHSSAPRHSIILEGQQASAARRQPCQPNFFDVLATEARGSESPAYDFHRQKDPTFQRETRGVVTTL